VHSTLGVCSWLGSVDTAVAQNVSDGWSLSIGYRVAHTHEACPRLAQSITAVSLWSSSKLIPWKRSLKKPIE
jgi:hypothetical protein